LPVASAQVKSAILLAGLYAEGTTEVIEPAPTRNHTELALQSFGAQVKVSDNRIALNGSQILRGIRARVPGDVSSAAFFIVAATVLPGSDLIIEGVGLNPGRRGIIDWLKDAGADIQILEEGVQGNEIVGSLRVRSSDIRGARIDGPLVPLVIDEIPILAVLATQTREGVEIREASELRVKESDRIQSTVENLRAMGAVVEEYPDGMFVAGHQSLRGSRIKPCGDHRIAMAFAVAALMAQGESIVEESECAAVSFPGYFDVLEQMVVR
jgi:3-phosphoshikimate 1-carboxyvinyltransferase